MDKIIYIYIIYYISIYIYTYKFYNNNIHCMYSLTFNVIKIKEEEKDHTNTAPYRLFINSKAIN